MQLHQYGKKTEKEIQEECRKIFIREYIRREDGSEVIIKTTDGLQVIFEEGRFDHAFGRERKPNPREFDYSRARRVFWIKKVIREKCEELKVLNKDISKSNYKQRLYYLPNKEYLVVLDWLYNDLSTYLKFNTHYTLTMSWKLTQIKQVFDIK